MSSGPTLTTTMLGTQTSILMISSVDYQHSGVYTCRAENTAGIAMYSAELKVNGKTDKHREVQGMGNILFTEPRTDRSEIRETLVSLCLSVRPGPVISTMAILGSQLT